MVKKTKEDAEKTRKLILDSAEVLFLSQGVSRTSLQAIAEHAGITRGAIYWHFKDKADLFNAMMDRVIWPMKNACWELGSPEAVAADPDPIATLRRSHIEAMTTLTTDLRTQRIQEIAIYRVELTDDMQIVREKTILSREHFYECNRLVFSLPTITKRLRKGVTAEAAARTMQTMIIGMIDVWILDPGNFDLVTSGTQAMDYILAGIGLMDAHLTN